MTDKSGKRRGKGSFRDPSGFVFYDEDGVLLRQVNRVYSPHYEKLKSSGLYENLAGDGLLIRHEEVDRPPAEPSLCDRVIRPQPVPFISYPYEWSYHELRDAALLTLEIQSRALDRGLVLKDAR